MYLKCPIWDFRLSLSVRRTHGPCVRSSVQKIRPKLASVKRNEEGERSEDFLFERSEFNVSASRTQSHACMSFAEAQPNFTFGVIFSEPKERSSEAGSALNFWLLFFQEKSNNPILSVPEQPALHLSSPNRGRR